MSKVNVNTIEPSTGTDITLGASGDTITVPSGATIVNSGTATGFGATLSGSTNNTVVTVTGANAMIGEAKLLFDPAKLTIGNASEEDTSIVFDGNAQDYYIGLDDTDDDLKIGLGSAVGTTAHMVFDETGAITKPLQPAFLAYASSTTNVTGDGTIITIVYGNEVFDQGGDYDTTTGIFTAPITGRYIVSTTFEFEPDSNHDTTYGYFISSNRSYPIFWQNPSATESAAGLLDIMGSTVLDMDSGDTVFVRWLVSGGSKTSDYGTANTFGGYLIC